MSAAEPFVLYVSKRFVDKASKTFGLGFIVRKPLVEILKKMNVKFKELDRDEAKAALYRLGELKGIAVSTAQLMSDLAAAFFPIAKVFRRTSKKVLYVLYRSGAETEDGVILEFHTEIARTMRTPLSYDIWLTVPKTEKGEANTKQIIKTVAEKAGVPPLTEEEWENAKPIIEELKGKMAVKGVTENLWTLILTS